MSNAYVNAAKKLRVGKRDAKQPIAKAILLFLADAANDDGFCYPSIAYIADVLELGESTVRKHLTILADKKNPFIEKKRIKKNNGYQMKFAPQKPKSPLRDSDDEESKLLRDSGENDSHRYVGESSPLRGVTATTERINITIKGTETSNETFLDLNTLCVSVEDFYKNATKLICAAMKVFNLPNADRWKKQMKWAFENKCSPEEFSECYKLLLHRKGRLYPVTPEQVADNLPFLTDLRLQSKNVQKTFDDPGRNHIHEADNCSPDDLKSFLETFKKDLENGNEDFVRGNLKYFSANDRAWLLKNLQLEDAA